MSCPVHKLGETSQEAWIITQAGHVSRSSAIVLGTITCLSWGFFVVFLDGTIMFNFNFALISTHCFYLSWYSPLHPTRAARMQYLLLAGLKPQNTQEFKFQIISIGP